MDVREYAKAVVVAWRGAGLGTDPPDAEFLLQESADLDVWFDCATIEPDADVEATEEVDLNYPWLRVKVTIEGDDPGLSCWMVGELVKREGPSGGPAS